MTTPRLASGPPKSGASSGGAVASAALAAGGWLLLMVSVPVAIFLTWWGDCLEETCPSASGLDRTAYLFDFAAWLVLPLLAFGAYRGWRPAAVALVGIGLGLAAQVVAGMIGARGFEAFAIVLPAAALIVAAGIIAFRPAIGAGGDGPTARTSLIGLIVLSAVVVIIAFQGLLTGGGGVGQGLLIIIAVSLTFISVAAYLNRGRRPPPPGPHRRG